MASSGVELGLMVRGASLSFEKVWRSHWSQARGRSAMMKKISLQVVIN